MIIPLISPKSVRLPDKNTDEIHLFLQFYVDANPERQFEIVKCLHKNIQNPYITKIHLLNERIYKNKEIGCTSKKLIQTNIGCRLKYSDIFQYVADNNIRGYIVISNSDILFDSTLENLLYSDIHIQKKMYAQLRYEYNSIDPAQSRIYGPRFDSQDVWIVHTNFELCPKQRKMFSFPMGKPGCDNKLIYLFRILGFEVLNDPAFIKTYHYHTSGQRNYTQKDTISLPWGTVLPVGYAIDKMPQDQFVRVNKYYRDTIYDSVKPPQYSDNARLYSYILSKISKDQPFVIPRIAGIENNIAWRGNTVHKTGVLDEEMMEYFNTRAPIFKNNAGIMVKTINDIIEYSQKYLKAFDNCEMYTGWEKTGNVYPIIPESHDYITNTYCHPRQMLWAFALDIYHYIYDTPWTFALRGKRILVISAFEESIREKLPIRAELYNGIDLFPECSFVTIKPPQTQGGNETNDYFGVYLSEFTQQLDAIRDDYDVALVSCGGYGNLVCNHIFESGKSAIYVGGVLQMYFGILGTRWLRERPDILRLFMNEHWARPKDSEKPKNHQDIEGSCYW
jgi:hypothetical protein